MAWWIFQNVVITAAFAAVVAFICRAGRIGPVGRHALWVLVLVKFVTPPLVVWPWAAPDPLGVARLDAGSRVVVSSLAAAPDSAAGESDAVPFAEPPALAEPVFDAAAVPDASPIGAVAWPWLLGLWAAGSVGVLVIEGVRLARLARRVRAAGPADPAIVRRVAELSARLGLRPIPVATLPGSASPVVWCLGRPRLLWPADLDLDSTGTARADACIDGLLVHELAHVKRGDHLVGWIELAAGIVWWWNPLFWFVRSALREQAELACDAWVISALPDGRRAYAESLLALSGAAMRGASSPAMAVVGIHATSRRSLERRLVMIMKGRASLRLPWVGLLCLAIVAAATLPAWATGGQQSTTSPQTPPTPVVKPATTPAAVTPTEPQRHTTPVQTHAPVAVVPVQTTHIQTLPLRPTMMTARPEIRAVLDQTVPTPVVTQQREWVMKTPPRIAWDVTLTETQHLTEEGQKLVDAFQTDREAIQAEADKKIKARQELVTKELEALQDRYTKAGKLDEAVAIRDYLRSLALHQNVWIRRAR